MHNLQFPFSFSRCPSNFFMSHPRISRKLESSNIYACSILASINTQQYMAMHVYYSSWCNETQLLLLLLFSLRNSFGLYTQWSKHTHILMWENFLLIIQRRLFLFFRDDDEFIIHPYEFENNNCKRNFCSSSCQVLRSSCFNLSELLISCEEIKGFFFVFWIICEWVWEFIRI